MKSLLLTILVIVSFLACLGQTKTRNIIVITLDGYRWQEVFNGVDSKIVRRATSDEKRSIEKFIAATPEESRKKLMPFFWEHIAKEGQLYGNRGFENKVNCSNMHLLSYPGYSEMLVGFPDRKVHSNSLIVNPNPTVFEFIHGHEGFKNRVAAFSTWSAFPYIFREELAGFHVNSGKDIASGNISVVEQELNKSMSETEAARADIETFLYAKEFLKRERPRVLFLGLDETDQNGHAGRYADYLNAAHRADSLIADLWTWCQADPVFQGNTTFLITTDHGRGNGATTWKNHRLLAAGSRQIWMAVVGPDTPAFGELRFKSKVFQKQIAKTIAAFLGLHYQPQKKVGEVIQTMVAAPLMDDVSITTTSAAARHLEQ